MVKVFKVWRNKEALKVECNKRNRNIRYAIFRYLNLKKLSEYLVLQSNIFQYFCDRFSKLKKFFSVFGPIIFYIFGRFVKTKYPLFWEWLWEDQHLQTQLKSICRLMNILQYLRHYTLEKFENHLLLTFTQFVYVRTWKTSITTTLIKTFGELAFLDTL